MRRGSTSTGPTSNRGNRRSVELARARRRHSAAEVERLEREIVIRKQAAQIAAKADAAFAEKAAARAEYLGRELLPSFVATDTSTCASGRQAA